MMMQLALDLVSFYSTFKKSTTDYIQNFSKALRESCKDNSNIEVLHIGSGFEDLYLPLLEDSYRVNVEIDHMIIRTDVPIYEMVDQGSKKTESYIHKINADDDITQNGIIFKNELPFFDWKLHYTFTKGDNLYMHNGCHQGYVFLSTEKSIADIGHLMEEKCLSSETFVFDNLKRVNINRGIFLNKVGHRTGPLFTKHSVDGPFSLAKDIVFALECKSWPYQAREWLTRHRDNKWPSEKQIKSIESSGCFVVPVASHHNTRLQDYEWRLSFTAAELKLTHNLPENIKFGYAVVKAIIKYNLKRLQLTGFTSYHLKTCLLWLVERIGLEKMRQWTAENIMHKLLKCLINFYSDSCLPNYFVRENNMIDHRDQAEIKQCVSALRDIKANLLRVMINYIDTHHKLLVEFDKTLKEYFNFDNNEMICQLIKYNFLLICLYQRLRAVADPSYIHINKQFLQKAHSIHNSNIKIHTNRVPLLSKPNEELSVYDILEVLSAYLETDSLLVTEKSGIALGVFNLVLVSCPDLAERDREKRISIDFDEYAARCSIFIDVLRWASLKHQLYADLIYEFVVKKWVNGPKLVSGDEKSIPFMKLLMVIFGKPTKQSKAFNGSLVKLEKDRQMFLDYRYFVSFVLFYDIDLAYILYQGIAWLMNVTTLDEIWLTIQYGVWKFKKIRAIKLIMSHEELRNALTDEQRNYIRTFEIAENDRI